MKSLFNKLAEALEALDKAGKRKQFDEKVKSEMTTEVRLNIAESILNVNISDKYGEAAKTTDPLKKTEDDLEEAKRDYAVLFGVEPRKKATNKETAQPITKNNGAVQNFVEGSPFNEGRSGGRNAGGTTVTETDSKITKKRKAMIESCADSMGCSKKEARAFLGLPPKKPKAYKNLSEGQQKEFDFARMIGISESDAFKLVALTGGYKEVSRR
jgi:hypothetical protein